MATEVPSPFPAIENGWHGTPPPYDVGAMRRVPSDERRKFARADVLAMRLGGDGRERHVFWVAFHAEHVEASILEAEREPASASA